MEQNVPNTETSGKSSASPLDSQPGAGYFDRAPDSQFFFPPSTSKTQIRPSTAQATENHKGTYSHDPLLNSNADELWRFLLSNLRQPRMTVVITGTHTENTTTNTGSTTSTSSRTVTDFCIRMNASEHVIPQWSQIASRVTGFFKGKGTPTIRETLEEYTSSENPMKEFELTKVVLWDFERITKSFKELIRSLGYRNTISVTFPMEDYKVAVRAANEVSKASHSKVVRVLCCVSCLWIVCWPAWAMARKRMDDRLEAEFSMALDADEFVALNSERISSVVSDYVEAHTLRCCC